MLRLSKKRCTYKSKEHQFAPVVKLPLHMRLRIQNDPVAWPEKNSQSLGRLAVGQARQLKQSLVSISHVKAA